MFQAYISPLLLPDIRLSCIRYSFSPSFTKTEDVYKRSLQAAKKGKTLTFHWRGGYLTREVLNELLGLIRKAGEEKNKTAVVNINWPQAVLRLYYTEAQMQECITMEDANEGEKE